MIWLAVIAVVEAVVYQARYRSAVLGGPFTAAWWAFATCAVRVLWLALGVGELMHGSDLVLVIAAYGFPAAVTVGVMRAIETRRGLKLSKFFQQHTLRTGVTSDISRS